jgi:hypothetical protein
MPETALTSATSFLQFLWQGHYWKISTQIRWIAQLVVFQLFDDAFYNYKASLYRIGFLIPLLFMNGGVKNGLILAAALFGSAKIWKEGKHAKKAEYVAEMILACAALWFYPVPTVLSCLVAGGTFIDVFARIKPTVTTIKLTKFILCGAIGITLALIFW